MAAVGCGGGGGTGQPRLNIYLSLPLRGERSADGTAVADGAKLALARAGGRVGEFGISARILDDTGGRGRWDPVVVAENARRAAQDSTAIGFIGDLDSGATRVSLPITNQAEITQISPGSPALDLTAERYRPSGDQTFARIVPNAAVLGHGADRLARRLRIDPNRVLIGTPGADALRGCREAAPSRYLISPYREPFRLDPRGRAFNRVYRRRFGQEQPASAYGYEAMSLLLEAIRRAGGEGGERKSVSGNVLATRDRHSLIGDYSIRPSGDTTLDLVTVYSIRGCRLTFRSEIRAER